MKHLKLQEDLRTVSNKQQNNHCHLHVGSYLNPQGVSITQESNGTPIFIEQCSWLMITGYSNCSEKISLIAFKERDGEIELLEYS